MCFYCCDFKFYEIFVLGKRQKRKLNSSWCCLFCELDESRDLKIKHSETEPERWTCVHQHPPLQQQYKANIFIFIIPARIIKIKI